MAFQVGNAPDGITLDKSEILVPVSFTRKLTATTAPSDASLDSVRWSSSAISIATVSRTGLVTGIAPGTATITAKTATGISATCAVTVVNPGAVWAQTTTAGSDRSAFESAIVAPDGSVYAAGYIYGTGTFNFGNGVTAAGTYASDSNALLVKYNSFGIAQWAKTVTAGTDESIFYSVAVAPDGSVYAAGYMNGNGTYNFGNGITPTGAFATDYNIVLVKYNSSGDAQWAQTVSAGPARSKFYSVAATSDGYVYACGIVNGTGTYNFGNGITASGANAGDNVILVKYNSSGMARWAQTVSVGPNISTFYTVAVASDGSVYAGGYMYGTGTYNFGNDKTAAGAAAGSNVLLVKYDSSGTAQWAQSVTAGSSDSSFKSLAIAADGSLYAGGSAAGNGTYNFGNGKTAAGTYVTSDNVLLVKYNSSGTAQWAQTVTAGNNYSVFYSVAVALDGSIYAAGGILGTGTFNFGNDITATGVNAGSLNCVLVQYDSSGTAQRAQTVTGSTGSAFKEVAAASDGSMYAAGFINGTGTLDFGNGITATGTYDGGANIVLVKYIRN